MELLIYPKRFFISQPLLAVWGCRSTTSSFRGWWGEVRSISSSCNHQTLPSESEARWRPPQGTVVVGAPMVVGAIISR
jgi:hypothetical protein